MLVCMATVFVVGYLACQYYAYGAHDYFFIRNGHRTSFLVTWAQCNMGRVYNANYFYLYTVYKNFKRLLVDRRSLTSDRLSI